MSNKQTPVVVFLRVSTDRQDTDRQRSELIEYAAKERYEVVDVIEEAISGNVGVEDRSGLKLIEELARTTKIKKVLVHEVSRIARRNSVAHRFIETMEEYGVSVYWHSQRIETLLPSGKRNPAASIMFSLLAEIARNERETLRERILSGLDEARRKGKVLGRPVGSNLTDEQLMTRHSDIVRQLRRGKSNRDVAKIVGKGVSTVKRVRKVLVEVA